jgi:hypothetical protein
MSTLTATWGTGAMLAAHLPLFATIPALVGAGIAARVRRGR